MRGSDFNVINVSTKEHKRVLGKCTKNQNMKASYKQDVRIHKESKHVNIKFNCDQCEYKATQKCHLTNN